MNFVDMFSEAASPMAYTGERLWLMERESMAERIIDIDRFMPARWRHTKEALRLGLTELGDGSRLTLACGVIAGRKDGPIVTVVAGQHGNEWNGNYLAHRLFKEIEPQDIVGKIVIIPVANPWAFWEKNRLGSIDKVDMNRSYSFTKGRRPTERIARAMFENVYSQSDFLLDIHSGGSGEFLPNIGITEQGRTELALSFNTGYVIITEKDRGSLVPACERSSVPAFSIEIGRGLSVDYGTCDLFLAEGVFNFLRATGVLTGNPETKGDQQLFTAKSVAEAPAAGFFRASVALGQLVEEGQNIGTIEPLFSAKPLTVKTSRAGTVINLCRQEVVGPGESLVHIAYSASPDQR